MKHVLNVEVAIALSKVANKQEVEKITKAIEGVLKRRPDLVAGWDLVGALYIDVPAPWFPANEAMVS